MKKWLMLLPLIILGCEQDPFIVYKEKVNDSIPKQKPEPPPKSIPSNVMFIDTENFYDLTEEKEFKTTLRYRISYKEGEFIRFYIEDLEERLPGAEFDVTTGELTWTPPINWVPPEDVTRRTAIRLVLEGAYKGSRIKTDKFIEINVLKADGVPEITGVRIPNARILEGSDDYIYVTVIDKDSPGSTSDLDQAPTLVVTPRPGYRDASSLMFVEKPRQDDSDRTKWEFPVRINTRNKELTRSRENFYFYLNAYSRFGISSAREYRSINIMNDPAAPVTSHSGRPVLMEVNKKNTFTFSIFDPKDEGRIEVLNLDASCASANREIKCSCERYTTTIQNCRLEWTPVEPGDVSLTIRSRNFQGSAYPIPMKSFGILLRAVRGN